MKNYGFIEPKLDSTQYVMGALTSLPKNVLQADGQWDAYLPEEERQQGANFDTYGCTSFATLNCVEILLNKIYGKYENKSDRFLGIVAGTRPPGNDPHVVAEAARKNGFIPEKLLPFSEQIKEVDQYYSYLLGDRDVCMLEGNKFLDQYSFGHEWVFQNVNKNVRISLMKEALKYSPLGCSVSAWSDDGKGTYVDYGVPNNHWTVIYGYDDKGWKCFDSYEPFKKTVSYDHNIQFCKRYSLIPADKKKDNWLIVLIKLIIGRTKPQQKVPDFVPTAPQPTVKSPRERLYEAAVSCLGMDASPNDVAPDELGCAESVNNIFFKAFGEYIETPGISTTKLFAAMVDRADKFVRVTDPEPGNIIISPTGFSTLKDNPIKNGHVGIFGKNGAIMSNSSLTGKFIENFTLDSWIGRYRTRGGYPIYYFKVI